MSRLSPLRPGSSGKHLPPVPAGRQWKIFVPVSLLHVLLIFGPLAYLGWRGAHQEENAFRVKIGGPDLSHDWNVGKPERLRPGADPGRLPDRSGSYWAGTMDWPESREYSYMRLY